MINDIVSDMLIKIDGDEALAHYGVLGMKWGVRRPVGSDGLVKRRARSEDSQAARQLKPKRQSEMSNSELRKLNERLQLEKTNRELQSRGALNKIKLGTSSINTILAIGVTATTLYNFINSPLGKDIRKMILEVVYKKPA